MHMHINRSIAAGTVLLAAILCASPVVAQSSGDAGGEAGVPCTVCDSPWASECQSTDVCPTEAERREDAYQRRLQALADDERADASRFPTWLHIDTLWVPSSAFGGTYGVLGAHIVIAHVGRLHLYGPPGGLLLLENSTGRWQVRPALTWGVSIHLGDVPFPGGRRTRVYANLAKVWAGGDQRMASDMAGLSLSWR